MLKPPEQFLSAQAAFFIYFSFFCCTCSWASCWTSAQRKSHTWSDFHFLHIGRLLSAPGVPAPAHSPLCWAAGTTAPWAFTGYDCLSVFRWCRYNCLAGIKLPIIHGFQNHSFTSLNSRLVPSWWFPLPGSGWSSLTAPITSDFRFHGFGHALGFHHLPDNQVQPVCRLLVQIGNDGVEPAGQN